MAPRKGTENRPQLTEKQAKAKLKELSRKGTIDGETFTVDRRGGGAANMEGTIKDGLLRRLSGRPPKTR